MARARGGGEPELGAARIMLARFYTRWVTRKGAGSGRTGTGGESRHARGPGCAGLGPDQRGPEGTGGDDL